MLKRIVKTAKSQARHSINRAMVLCYWDIGHAIIEYEQKGQYRAAYGKEQLKALSDQLSRQFGKGFDITNLRREPRLTLVSMSCTNKLMIYPAKALWQSGHLVRAK